MKKLNIPLIAGLMIGSVGLTLGVYLLHGYQVNRSASGLLERAAKAAEEGRTDEQIKMLRRYLAHRPEDLQQLKALLKVSRQHALASESVSRRDLQMLLEAIERAIRENAEDADLRREGFEFNSTVGLWPDAIEHAQQLAAMNAITPADEVKWAICLYRMSNIDGALEKLGTLIGFNLATMEFEQDKATAPAEIDAYRYFVYIYQERKAEKGDSQVALKVLDKLVERNPKNADGYLLRAGFLQSMKEKEAYVEKIAADLREAEKLAPDNVDVVVSMARQAMGARDLPKAKTLLLRALELAPNNARIYVALSDLHSQMEEPEEAMKIVEQGLARQQENPELLLMRADLEIDKNDLTHAQETIERLAKNKAIEGEVQVLKSRVMMAKGENAKAVTVLERLLPLLDSNPSLRTRATRILADGYRRLNRLDKLNELTRDASGGESFNAPELLTRAEALNAQGDIEGALKLFLELMEKPELLTPKGREQVFGQVYQLRIKQQTALPASKRNWSEVDRMAKVLLDREDLPADVKDLVRIELLTQKEQLDEARKLAEQSLGRYPNQPSFLFALARLTRDPKQAEQLLNQVENIQGDSAELRIARGELIIKGGGSDVLERLAKLEENDDKLSLMDQIRLWASLSSLNERAGNLPKSVVLLRKILSKPEQANNVTMRQMVFERALAADLEGDMDDMITEVAKVVGESSSEVMMMKATRTVAAYRKGKGDEATLDEVTQMIEKIRATRPDYAPVYALEADVHLLQNKAELAVESLEKSLEKRPNDVVVLRKLIEILTQIGDADKASRYMAQLPDDQKRRQDVVSELRLLLAKDPNAAYARMLQVVDANTSDAAELILKGEVEYSTGHVAEATKTFKRLTEVDPAQTRGWLLYVRSLMETNQKAEAEAAIERIKTSVPAKEQPLLLGQCYTTVRNLTAAAQAYDEGLKADPDNLVLQQNRILVHVGLKENEAAHGAIDALIGKTKPADIQTLVWARRLKAQLLANAGPYQDFLKALSLLEQNVNPETGEMLPSDRLLWLNYCAKRPEAESRRKALTLLTGLEGRRTLTADESVVMAELYKMEGRWEDAKRVMVALVAANPDNAQLLAKLLDWLLERGDFADANVWLSKLDQNSPAVIRFKALVLAKNNKDKDAAKLVLASTPSKIPLTSAVTLLEELGTENPSFFKVADTQWKKLVAQNPGAQLSYIEFLTRYPKGEKIGDAIQGADAELKKFIAEKNADGIQTVIKLGLTGLRNNRRFIEKNSPLYAQVASWFEQVRESKLVDSKNLTWNEIDYHDIRQDYKRLETIYLGLLKDPTIKDFDKALIRNNLAYGYAITNQGEKALDVIGDAISQIGPQSAFLDTRGLAYLSSNKVDLALKDLQEAVSGGEGSASTYFHLALAEWKGKNNQEAVAALETATQMGLSEADLSPSEIALLKQMREALKGAKTNTKPAANKNAGGNEKDKS